MPPFISNLCLHILHQDQLFLFPCTAPEQEWNGILIKGLTIGAGDVSPEELYAVLKKRRERILIRTVRQATHFNIYFIFFVWVFC